MSTEYFDLLDCRGLKTGEIISRDDAHRTGAWHGAFHCLIVYQRTGKRYALFQKRALEKKIAPGKFDVSVGGHYSTGENAAVAGPREIGEELGLTVTFPELIPLGRRVFVYCFTPGITEYEFQDVFLLDRLIRPEGLAQQRDELDGVIELEVEEGIALFSGKQTQVDTTLFTPAGLADRIQLEAKDFVPCLDTYYLKLLQLAKRYFEGDRSVPAI